MKQDVYQQLIPGKYYHIYNRGNNKEIIFKEPENYHYFLARWIKYIEPVAETFCYNLLPNHFHFFIRVKENGQEEKPVNISKAFANLFNSYAKAINSKYERTGSLFQERFRRKEIATDSYFTGIVGYILTNAVKHGCTENVTAYPYCAYNILLSEEPTRLLREEVLAWFGGKDKFCDHINAYQENIIDLQVDVENEWDEQVF